MNVKILKVFGVGIAQSELALAAQAASKTWKCKRYSLPVSDALHGQGFEILLFDDRAQEVIDDEDEDYDDVPY